MNTPAIRTRFAQFLAIARYDFLLAWRQRAWLVALIPICAIMAMMCFAFRDVPAIKEMNRVLAARNSPTGEVTLEGLDDVARTASTFTLYSFGLFLHMVGIALFPVLFADAIPRDTRLGLREVYESLPLSHGVYLAGKVAGALLSVLAAMLLAILWLGVLWWFVVYPFHALEFAGLSALAILPVGLLNSALAILLAAGQPTRRRGLLIGAGFVILSFLAILLSTGAVNGLDFLNIGRPLPFRYYINQLVSAASSKSVAGIVPVSLFQIGLGVLAGLVEIAAAWWIAQRWFARQAGR